VNHWSECIDIWQGASFGQGDVWPRPKGTHFYNLYSNTLKNFMNDWPEYLDICQGFSNLFKWSPWGHKWSRPRGT